MTNSLEVRPGLLPDLTFDVLCIGETMMMVTPDAGHALAFDSTFSLHAGGAESNVASLMATLGHRAAWASRLGADPFGAMILQSLRDARVDVSLVQSVMGGRTGVYFKDPKPSGTSVHYYRSDSAAAQMTPANLGTWANARAGILHLSGITSALSPGCRDLVRALVNERPIARSLLSFDVNYRPSLWSTADAAPELLSLAQASDIVFVGLDEAEALWGVPTAEDVRRLIDRPAHLVVKDGAREAVSFQGNEVVRVAAPRVDVVEVVGAGDAFAAGWLSGILSGEDATRRLRLGHLVASRVLGSTTDSGHLPGAGEIAELIARDTLNWDTASPHTAAPGARKRT